MLLITFDPDNRLAADALEADWNEELRALAAAQEAYEKAKAADANVVTEVKRANWWRSPPTSRVSGAIREHR